ncbi:MAG TPA: hypothetical protein VNP95_08060, partial [Thermomicrobiales bacterium]|nr:hypothetical protein [Thermomicrobiales bacterium]
GHADRDADGNSCSHAHGDCHSDTDGDADRDTLFYPDRHGDYRGSDRDRHSHDDRDVTADERADGNVHRDLDRRRDRARRDGGWR